MARIRTIKPEMFQDEKLAPADVTTRFVFLGLISMADDAGRVLDNVRVIDAFIFPETSDSSHEPLMRLSRMGLVVRGKTASGQRVLQIANWKRHQRIEHPNLKGALPEIVEVQPVTEIHEALMNDSRGIHEPLTHHTNDQRPVPTTNDQYQGATVRTTKSRRPPQEPRFPDFPIVNRQDVHAYWQEKVGSVDFARLVAAIGPYWTTEKAAIVNRAVRDYCGLITKGRSAPFASPADLAKKIGALIGNAERHRDDAILRTEGAEVIVHGQRAA